MLDNCDDDARCTNLNGSFECECNPGFAGDGVECSDIDECSLSLHTCDANATCTNLKGSFSCRCGSRFTGFEGFMGDGHTCFDIKE